MPDTTASEPPPSETTASEEIPDPPPPSNNNTEDLPPLRLHATRVPERLSSSSSLPTPTSSTKKHVRRRSLDPKKNPPSRSKSPSTSTTGTTAVMMDGGSSLSSLEDFVDSDILTDSKGMKELSVKDEERKTHQLHQSSGSLAPVHERLSEETLEDVHAFADLQPGMKTPSLSSRGNSTVGTAGDVGSYLLETLDEEEGEQSEDEGVGGGEVIFTNMENLTIHEEVDVGEGDTSLELSSAPNTSKTV